MIKNIVDLDSRKNGFSANPPEFIAVGHVTLDWLDTGITPGGSALYAAITATRLSMSSGILTSMGDDFPSSKVLSEIKCFHTRSARTTTFINQYDGCRFQKIQALADNICLESLPSEWENIPVVYFCPVAEEIKPQQIFRMKTTLWGAGLQGWLRTWDETGRIRPARLKNEASFLTHFQMVFMSEEDIMGMEDIVDECRRFVPMVFVTKGSRGATAFIENRCYQIPAYHSKESDPTGAGDVFAATFMIEYYRSRKWERAVTLASCAASLTVEAPGISGIPTTKAVLDRLRHQMFKFPFAL